MAELQEVFEVDKISETLYRSKHFLSKPHPSVKGVYGGNLCAQALLVAVRSVPKGFVPHSLHSYFVKSGRDDVLFDWEVEKISDGKTFSNRIIRGKQNGELKYLVNVSLTRKNSEKESQREYEEYKRAKAARKPAAGSDDDDDDDDDLKPVARPVSFGRPYPEWLGKYKPEDLKTNPRVDNRHLSHKLTPEMTDLQLTLDEEKKVPTERQVSFFVKWGKQDGRVIKVPNLDEFRYAGLGFISDSLFLTRLGRLLRIPLVDHGKMVHYFSVSLDHIMYFHDTDFDPTDWMGFGFNVVRLANNRALIEGEFYNSKGKHVASVIQEGIAHLGALADKAKL